MANPRTCSMAHGTNANHSVFFHEDFWNYTTAGAFTTVAGSSGTSVADDTATLVTGNSSVATNVLLTTAATNNDAQGVKTTKQNFLPVAGRSTYYEAYFYYANQYANGGAIYFGLASTQPNGNAAADPSTSYSGALIYKLTGDVGDGTTGGWRCQVSNGSTKTTSQSKNVLCTDGQHLLRIDITDWDNLNALVTYKVDNVLLTDQNTGLQIAHKVAYASLAKGNVWFLAQDGAGQSGVQTAYVDYIAAGGYRGLLGG